MFGTQMLLGLQVSKGVMIHIEDEFLMYVAMSSMVKGLKNGIKLKVVCLIRCRISMSFFLK